MESRDLGTVSKPDACYRIYGAGLSLWASVFTSTECECWTVTIFSDPNLCQMILTPLNTVSHCRVLLFLGTSCPPSTLFEVPGLQMALHGLAAGSCWRGGDRQVLTIFSRVANDSVRLWPFPEVILGLDPDLIGHIDRGLPHHIARAPHRHVVPCFSGLPPPPLDNVAQVGSKGRSGIHGLHRDRQTGRVKGVRN